MVWTPMQETMKNHRLLGPGKPPHRMAYTWWTPQKREMVMEQWRMTPPRNSLSAGVSGAAQNPAKTNTITSTGDNNTPESAEENPLQQDLAQEDGETSPHERAVDREVEDDNYMPPSEDEASLGDDEFVVPEDPVEQERFKRRLIATANSLKKKQQQLQADQDLLADRWTEVLAAEEYKLERPSKSYPKCRLLPRLEEEASKPTSPAYDAADRPPRGRGREASRPTTQAEHTPAPLRRKGKETAAARYTYDLRQDLDNRAG